MWVLWVHSLTFRNALAEIEYKFKLKLVSLIKVIYNLKILQSFVLNSVILVCNLFIVFVFHIFYSSVCPMMSFLFVCFVFFLIILVTWTGNFSLLAWLEISVCCKISEVRRFFRQPAAWHVSLFGTTGYFVCRGNTCILCNVHHYSRNCVCWQHDVAVARVAGWATDLSLDCSAT